MCIAVGEFEAGEVLASLAGEQGESATVGVPFVDLKAPSLELREELTAVFTDVLSRAAFIMGPELSDFEAAFAAFCETTYCAGVGTGTAAVRLALQAAGVRPGDDVIVPANTFIATAEAVSHLGARPVFVDCLIETATIDPGQIGPAVTPRTTAVVPVHLYGRPADMTAVLRVAAEHGLAVVEDACQAHGARFAGRTCGSFGATAAFSFYPGKNLGALGDGGAVTTSDVEADRAVRSLRNHGELVKSVHETIGLCERLDNLQAGFLLVKLAHLERWNEARRRAAAYYDAALHGNRSVELFPVHGDAESVHHLYVIQIDERERVRSRLAEAGVQTGVHYPTPLHLTPAYGHLGYAPGDFPVAERLAPRILSLPMYPQITTAQQDHVVAELRAALDEVSAA